MIKYWLIFFSLAYLGALAFSAYKSKKSIKSEKDYSLPQIGAFLGCMTFSASLFSTFTLMGMPDFFRTHGVGAWIFSGVTDTALAFVILWFGTALRKRYSQDNFTNISSIIKSKFESKFAVNVYKIGIFIFLVPYVSIQIKGVSEFVGHANIMSIPSWAWACFFLLILLTYSFVGGLKAIILSDAIQGIILLVVTAVIAYTCLNNIGGAKEMFNQVSIVDERLLSTPGPKGLFTNQYLFASFLAIVLMPISQPQLMTRMVIMSNTKDIKKMAGAIGILAFIIIFSTIFIGFYGIIRYSDADTYHFLYHTLVEDQHAIIGSLAIIGLIAASMSTTDSQLFAIQAEVVSKKNSRMVNKLYILIFGLIALTLSILSSHELVLLARISFAGTALLAPMVFISIFSDYKLSKKLPIFTFISIIIYLIASLCPCIPEKIFGLQIDILFIALNSIIATISYYKSKSLKLSLKTA
ncbi:MAG: hypothetical protein N4A49_16935 [Marinifilaceae bacterium]|jgi:SSS family solute:Na+ symporter|nr:hypothetical protein [Marinifilaceae bacterium]